jgi:hypothetical protein
MEFLRVLADGVSRAISQEFHLIVDNTIIQASVDMWQVIFKTHNDQPVKAFNFNKQGFIPVQRAGEQPTQIVPDDFYEQQLRELFPQALNRFGASLIEMVDGN